MGRGGSVALLAHQQHFVKGDHTRTTAYWRAKRLIDRSRRPAGPGKPSGISDGRLHGSPRCYRRPVWRVICPRPYQPQSCEETRLVAGFALRCIQRFALPAVATRPAGRPTAAPPAGRPARSSRTRASPTQSPKRPHRIETELSHDVLNPARVPLSWANSPTLGTGSSPRMRRADIEVPNPTVDLNSWVGSACYPRGSFYPVRYGTSTRHRRITRPDFRPCAACLPCSQAPLCPCTPWVIAIHPEGTFGRLRYTLGGDRPSQTPHQPRFQHLSVPVSVRTSAEWYFTVASSQPASPPSSAPTYPTQHHRIHSGKLE
jgi:hypothetical protein